MRITKIEIAGFKSFRDRTGLVLENGITAIVGPNGCGKSNIIDGIRWALGEQKASALRGGKMADVIFAGSADAKPVGMAEVKLTFEVGDAELPAPYDRHAEVVVARRLYRNGDSDYRINNESVRLRDVQQLFLGTGAGTSTYSIIAQGTVDFIVTARPSERRALLEEAAGISRYKLQRKTSQRNLDQTATNLERIDDLFREVSRQVSSLRQQAARAERYHQMVGEERELALTLWLDGRRTNLARCREVRESGEVLTKGLAANHESRDAYVRAVEDARVYVELARRRYDTAVEGALRAEGRRDLLRGKHDQAERDQRRLERGLEQSEARLLELQSRAAENAKELARLDHLLGTSDDDAPSIEAIASAATAASALKAERDALRERVTALARARREVEGRVSQLRERVTSYDQQVAALSIRREQAETAARTLRENQGRARAALDEAEAEMECLEVVAEDLSERVDDADERTRSATEATGAAERRARVHDDAVLRLSARIEALESSRPTPARTSPLPPALEARLRPLAASLDIAAGRGDAIATALDGDLDASFIVLSAAELTDTVVLDALRDSTHGRILALPTRGAFGEPLPLGIRVASSDLASVETGALAHWLASRLADRRIEPNAAVPSPEPGAVAGGWLRDAAGALRRVRSGGGLAVLRHARDLREARAALGDAEEEAELAHRDLALARARLDERKQVLAVTREEQLRVVTQLRRAESTVRERTVELRNFDVRRTEIEGALATVETERNALLASREAAETERVGAEQIAAEAVTEAERFATDALARETAAAEAEAAVAAMRVERAAADARRQGLVDAMASARKTAATLGEELDQVQGRARGQRDGLARVRHELERTDADAAAILAEVESAVAERAEAEASRQTYEQARLESEGKLREVDAVIERQQARQHELRLERERLDVARDALDAQHVERYATSVEDARDELGREVAALGDVESATARLVDLRDRLRRFGDVNTGAVKEFDEAREREVFIETQRTDLRAAIADLEEAIARIDEICEARFAETFAEVNIAFGEVYQRLFNGGEARLALTEPENVLDTGVEIFAQPPGKKQQALSLLSGGEKALTAVSLMMALFILKPAPFCILDEVDAPLDDVNVTRFARLLDDLAEKSQLLVVTHNRLTMRAADRLYGVTQEKRGVSKLVSVVFEELGRNGSRPAATSPP